MQVGDLVKVKTKFHGHCVGTIVGAWDSGARCPEWIVHIPNHWTAATVAPESDIEVVNASG